MWPFKDKKKQRKAGMIALVVGAVVMIFQLEFTFAYKTGLIISAFGLIYLLEASLE